MTWMTLINKEQLLDAVMKKSYSQASIQLINDQPEVKAIPIEWLKKQVEIYFDLGLDTIAKELKYLIFEWEKENENKY